MSSSSSFISPLNVSLNESKLTSTSFFIRFSSVLTLLSNSYATLFEIFCSKHDSSVSIRSFNDEYSICMSADSFVQAVSQLDRSQRELFLCNNNFPDWRLLCLWTPPLSSFRRVTGADIDIGNQLISNLPIRIPVIRGRIRTFWIVFTSSTEAITSFRFLNVHTRNLTWKQQVTLSPVIAGCHAVTCSIFIGLACATKLKFAIFRI